ncbi:unnamed protein product [Arctogadus glacialis]
MEPGVKELKGAGEGGVTPSRRGGMCLGRGRSPLGEGGSGGGERGELGGADRLNRWGGSTGPRAELAGWESRELRQHGAGVSVRPWRSPAEPNTALTLEF